MTMMAIAPYKTPTGIYVDLANPKETKINLEDIAWNLAGICRYGGSTLGHYSVAQHCVFMDSIFSFRGFNNTPKIWSKDVQTLIKSLERNPELERRVRLEILLHDASEAYLGDVPSPLKKLLPQYKTIEDQWTKVIRNSFNLPEINNTDSQSEIINELVKGLDVLALHIERRWVQAPDVEKQPLGTWGEEDPNVQAMAEWWLPIIEKKFWSREVGRKAFEARYKLILENNIKAVNFYH